MILRLVSNPFILLTMISSLLYWEETLAWIVTRDFKTTFKVATFSTVDVGLITLLERVIITSGEIGILD